MKDKEDRAELAEKLKNDKIEQMDRQKRIKDFQVS